MSFLSGSTKSYSQPEQKPLGLDSRKLATNEQARPVPVVYGAAAAGITFLSQAFHQVADAQTEEIGKEDRVVGYHYSCCFAALVCQGPVDRLDWIRFDDEQVWPAAGDPGKVRDTTVDKVVRIRVIAQGSGYTSDSVLSFDGAGAGAAARLVVKSGKIVEVIVTAQGSGYNPAAPPTATASIGSGATFQVLIGSETHTDVTITFQSRTFSWRFYWGMEATDYDDLLLTLSPDTGRNPPPLSAASGVIPPNEPENHPAYAGQCYFVANSHYLGYNKTSIQQITLGVSRFPKQAWMESLDTPVNVSGDCNPVAAIAEDLQNARYGLGVIDARLGTVEMDKVAQKLASEGIGISPVVTKTTSFREHLTSLLEYFDGFHYTDELGRLSLGLIRSADCQVDDPPSFEDWTGEVFVPPHFDEESLVEVPKLDPMSWEDTLNFVYVTFTNRNNGYKEDAVGAPNRANFQITGEPSAQTLQRPFFTRPDLADSYARAMVQVLGLPKRSGRLVVRKSRLQSLTVGGIFKLSYGHHGLCYLLCRATEIRMSDPYRPEVEIGFEVDRGYMAQHTYQAPVYVAPEPIVQPVEAIAQKLLVELPYVEETGGTIPRVLFLVTRPTNMTTGFTLHLVEGSQAKPVKSSQNFAYHGTLDANYDHSATGDLTVSLDGVDTTLPNIVNVDAFTDAWLLFVGDEIMTITHATLVSSLTHTYDLTVARERWDTKRLDHVAGAGVFILPRTKVASCVLSGKVATQPWNDGDSASFKVQPSVLGSGQDIAEIDADSITFTDRAKRWWKPRDLTVNGTVWHEGPASYSSGQDLAVSWTRVSPLGQNVWGPNMTDLWVVELRDTADTVRGTKMFSADAYQCTWTNAELINLLGGQVSCKVRIYASQSQIGTSSGADLLSRHYDEIEVTKV